jgi:PQQ-dependent catabolism-associated CXXCW motif protein
MRGAALAVCLTLWSLASGAAAQDKAADTAPPEPAQYRMSDYRSPTPSSLSGATVVSPAAALALWKSKSALFIDVLPRPHKPDNLPPQTVWHVPERLDIPGSAWLPNTGAGVLAPAAAAYFETQLERLTGGERAAPILFYCLKDCWMSWNAAKRALGLGYARVYWSPEGTDGWAEIGGPLEPAEPVEPYP